MRAARLLTMSRVAPLAEGFSGVFLRAWSVLDDASAGLAVLHECHGQDSSTHAPEP